MIMLNNSNMWNICNNHIILEHKRLSKIQMEKNIWTNDPMQV